MGAWGKGLLAGLAATALAVMVSHVNLDPQYYDEANRLYGAERLLQGQMPHRDFHFMYGFGQLVLCAAAFQIGGVGLLSYRVMIFGLAVGKLMAIWFLARGLSSAWIALGAAVAAASLVWQVTEAQNEPGLTLVLVSLALAGRGLESGQRRWVAAAGAAVGLVGWFRWDWFAFALAGVAAWSLLLAGRLGRLQSAALAGLTAVVVFGLGVVLFYGGALAAFWEDGVRLPMRITHFRQLPWPMPPPPNPWLLLSGQISLAGWWEVLWIRTLFYGPGLIIATAAVAAARAEPTGRRRRAAVVAAAAPWFYAYAALRSDTGHVLPVVQLAMPLGAYLWGQAGGWKAAGRRTARGLLGAAALVAVSWPVIREVQAQRQERAPYELARAWGMRGPAGQVARYEAAVRCVQSLTDGAIFVGATRHDRVTTSDILFYFLSERPSATGLYHFDPGLTDTRPAQEQIVRDLEERRVRVVVRWRQPPSQEPNRTQWGSGERTLDEHIQGRYRFYACYGDHEIWIRRDDPS